MADLYNKAQYIYVAGANKSGSIYGIVPIAGTSNVTLASSSTSRVSSGSRTNSNGIIELVAPHILRVDYPFQDTCPSYKFEPDRTNYVYDSDYLSTSSYWATQSGSWSLVSEPTSPIGTGLSGLFKEAAGYVAGGYGKYVRSSTSLPASLNTSTYTVSVYVKRSGSGADTRNIGLMPVAAGEAAAITNFVLEGTGSIATGTKTYVSGAFIEQLQNGWYRCSVLANGQGAGAGLYVYLTSGSTYTFDYTGNGTAAMYVCAAQLESGSTSSPNRSSPSIAAGSYITSYISTSNAAATRNADRSITLAAPISTTNWTYFMTFRRNYIAPNFFDLLIGSGSGYAGMYNNGVAIWASGSGTDTKTSGSSLPIGVEHKVAMRMNSNTLTYFINGSNRFSIPWTAGSWGSPIIADQNAGTSISHMSSFYVRVAAMFSQSLSDAECISLTTTGSGTSIV